MLRKKAASRVCRASHACEERADVLANAIIQVWIPALGLFFERFPADEDVERGFAFEYRV